jgi:hypothetical protein
MNFRTILAGLTGFPPPLHERSERSYSWDEDLNAGRREWRDPARKEKCFQCGRPDSAVVFLYCPPTSQLKAEHRAYCEPCWTSNPASTPINRIATVRP